MKKTVKLLNLLVLCHIMVVPWFVSKCIFVFMNILYTFYLIIRDLKFRDPPLVWSGQQFAVKFAWYMVAARATNGI